MKHLELDANGSSANRMVFRILCQTGTPFNQFFSDSLASREDLRGLNPVLNGSRLSIDVTNIPGAADAFDSLVGEAKSAAEHTNNVKAEWHKHKQQTDSEAVKQFKKSQRLE